ncbi:MAG: alanine racemase [Muribaculaceae bacterium]|nr:alanine racemase [Muribaculaceae bacterium]
MKLTLTELSEALNIPVTGTPDQTPLSRPLTDSRSLLYPDGTLFFALTTPSNDGHRYVRELYRHGVRHFAVSEEAIAVNPLPADASALVAHDADGVLDILQRSAAYVRSLVDCPIIAVTGSRGKSLMKEYLAEAFSSVRVTASPRSWNSQTGVPLSLWRLQPDTRLGIFEAGISRPGEMERLAGMIRPTIGVFTGLTDEHSGDFTSLEHKCREKAELFREVSHILYFESDPLVEGILHEINPTAKLIRVDDAPAAARTIAEITGLPLGRLPEYCVRSTRLDITEGDDGRIVATDHFSTDPGAIETALDRFGRRTGGRRLVAIIGDLALRGSKPEEAYRELERLLLAHGADSLIGVGKEISRYISQFGDAISHQGYPTADSFLKSGNDAYFADSAILISGNSGSEFELISRAVEPTRHPTCLEVNLDSLTHNFNYFRSLVAPTTGLVAMIKADAYGAGAVEVARTLQNQGAAYLAVAVIEEGLALRRGGISMPVMVLNPLTTNANALIRNNLEPTIFSISELATVADAVNTAGHQSYPIHIKLDTGMHRFGFNESELPDLMEQLRQYPSLRVASVFSHLATADCPEMDDYTLGQLKAFDRMSQYIADNLDYKIKRHILNTAGIMRYPEYQYDMVRLGIGLYGVSPLDSEMSKNLLPVSTLVTSISAVKERHPGDTIGYSRRGKVNEESAIATVPIGYADGLNRHLGNGALRVFINGHRCPTIGNICMDICMIDVTGCDARPGDRVEIFGPNIPVEEVAEILDTIPYEVLTSVAPRVKRIYFRE